MTTRNVEGFPFMPRVDGEFVNAVRRPVIFPFTFVLILSLTSVCAQSVSVSSFGAVGDGVTDDTAAIQRTIDQSPSSATVDFGAVTKTYLISNTLSLSPNRTYSGQATIRMAPQVMPHTAIGKLLYTQSDNVTISGLTFDASFVGGVLQIAVDGGNSIPAKNLTIVNCKFQNTRANAEQLWDAAIYNPVGLQTGTITGSTFVNCGSGILLSNPDQVSITLNSFDTISQDAIFIPVYPVTFQYGDGLSVTYNSGTNLSRMAIEIWGGGGNIMNAPVIQGNSFLNWNANAVSAAYGISVVVGQGAQIMSNTLTGGIAGYGIEIGSPGAVVSGNSIAGFPIGIVIQGQAGVTVRSNTLTAQTDTGITLSNVGNNRNTNILSNTIVDAKNFGIGASPNDYSGSLFDSNIISRAGGHFPDDAAGSFTFIGIKIDAGLAGPITVSNNQVIQTATNPPLGFSMSGIGMFSGYSNSHYTGNTFQSNSAQPMGSGFLLWYGNYLDQSSLSNNYFLNLASIDNGYTSPSIKTSNNRACNVKKIDANVVNLSNSCGAN